MEKRVLTCLRSGGDFQPRHVRALQRQLKRWAPDASFACLSDVPIAGVETIPLKYDWPNWWAKMEMFRPDIPGNFLFTDLDNVIVGPLDDILAVKEFTNQRGQSNALTYVTDAVRVAVWDKWIDDPYARMLQWSPLVRRLSVKPSAFGDGGFIASCVQATSHWEDLFPDQVVNLNTLGMRQRGPLRPIDVPKTARVVLCWRPHRPWLLPVFRRLYQEKP